MSASQIERIAQKKKEPAPTMKPLQPRGLPKGHGLTTLRDMAKKVTAAIAQPSVLVDTRVIYCGVLALVFSSRLG